MNKTIEEVTKFMEDNGYSYPALMDTTGDVLLQYYITAFPTTFMIDREGRVIGYASARTKDIMKNIITQALSVKAQNKEEPYYGSSTYTVKILIRKY